MTTMWVRRSAVFVITLALAMSTSADTVYKAVGPDGEITYSDKPPADRARTNTLEFRNLPSSPLPAEVLRFREQLEKSAQGADQRRTRTAHRRRGTFHRGVVRPLQTSESAPGRSADQLH